jgi:hypothetical protein
MNIIDHFIKVLRNNEQNFGGCHQLTNSDWIDILIDVQIEINKEKEINTKEDEQIYRNVFGSYGSSD